MSPRDLLDGLADGSLPPAQLNHGAHVEIAWELLQQLPLAQAEQRFCTLVMDYVRNLGADEKFHMTVSVALIRIMAARRHPQGDWQEFRLLNEDLFRDARGLLARYYSAGRLAEGRLQFVEPDLRPLPVPRP